ncbi:hypothetical protein [Rathayibacter sp. SD072]|uniref:hypothetical protein n=1 Tax=Rathayibacter sp. SD072 TaxID=2781731 RepID=UPI001A95D14F|nr:hypothetical protein [Rathayibacter sp. SD072]MBO0984644.1 hypothetical protein [Rathayibacter sp. SD072]
MGIGVAVAVPVGVGVAVGVADDVGAAVGVAVAVAVAVGVALGVVEALADGATISTPPRARLEAARTVRRERAERAREEGAGTVVSFIERWVVGRDAPSSPPGVPLDF